MTGGGGPGESAAYCAEQVRAHDFVAYVAALFAPPEQRRALLALAAFNGEIARVRDHVSQPLPGEIRLQWWTDTLSGPVHGGIEGNPIAVELLRAVQGFALPVAQLLRLIDGHRADLYDDPIPTQDSLEAYLGETDAVLVALALRICDPDAAIADDLIRHAGLALGLARVIGRLPVHAARRQLYLPQELLDLNGVRIEDIFAGNVTPSLRAVLAVLRREARGHLDRVCAAIAGLPPQLIPAMLPLAMVRWFLASAEREHADPLRPPLPSRLVVLWKLWRAAGNPRRI